MATDMLKATPPAASVLARQLFSLTEEDQGYWNAYKAQRPAYAPKLVQYPAMMVPSVQGKLLDVLEGHLEAESVSALEPFAGSGTVVAEAIWRGWDITAVDINPLAALICEVRAGPYHSATLARRVSCLKKAIRLRRKDAPGELPLFRGRDKWFAPGVSRGLACIREAILDEPRQWARKFFWICLAETTRLASNSRTSTYKLHKRPADEIQHRPDPIQIFTRIVDEYSAAYQTCQGELEQAGYLAAGRPTSDVEVIQGDIRDVSLDHVRANLVVSSPPYGDNRTTVPYGQAAYLALNVIDRRDLQGNPSLWGATTRLDTASLGGSSAIVLDDKDLQGKSPSYRHVLKKLRGKGRMGAERVSRFVYDLDQALERIAGITQPGGFHAWTLGSRSVCHVRVPLHAIMQELLEVRGFEHVATLDREILCKRTPDRNAFAETMSSEEIVLLRRP